jgi:hypothetical protein
LGYCFFFGAFWSCWLLIAPPSPVLFLHWWSTRNLCSPAASSVLHTKSTGSCSFFGALSNLMFLLRCPLVILVVDFSTLSPVLFLPRCSTRNLCGHVSSLVLCTKPLRSCSFFGAMQETSGTHLHNTSSPQFNLLNTDSTFPGPFDL